jgi:hypothetical protein
MNCFSIKEEVFEIIEHLTLKDGDAKKDRSIKEKGINV